MYQAHGEQQKQINNKQNTTRPTFEKPRTAWQYGIWDVGQRLGGDNLQRIYLIDGTAEFRRYQSICSESHDKRANRRKSVPKSAMLFTLLHR